MTSRMTRFSSSNEEEKVKLLNQNHDEDEVIFSGLPMGAVTKKRTRKLSDEVCNLVDVGNVPKAPPLDQCVEAEVQPGDTLASISLKYNIPVAELKRVNNILSETHFYALKRIKIPVKAASLLTELLPSVHEAKGEAKLENGWFVRDVPSPVQTGGTSSTVPSSPPSDTEFEILQLNGGSIAYESQALTEDGRGRSKQAKKAKRFLKNVDKDLARIKEKLDIDDDTDNDEKDASTVTIRNDSSLEDSNDQLGFVDSIRASRSRTACCLFVVIISVVIIVILIFARQEYEIIEEKHHHHHQQHNVKQH